MKTPQNYEVLCRYYNMWKYLVLSGLFLLLTFCKSAPNQGEPRTQRSQHGIPSAMLEFERIEIISMKQAALHYTFKADNPRSRAMDIEITGWNGLLNGVSIDVHKVAMQLNGENISGIHLGVEPVSALEKDMVLYLDLNDGNEFKVELFVDLEYHYLNEDTLCNTITANVTFPWTIEPKFTITSIKILQADIVNTGFELRLIVKNPNIFPIKLMSFRYELYGDGNFWADGMEKDLLLIPAKSSLETIINFKMNFIGMNRRLLDDIVAMRQVRYRIIGEMEIGTDKQELPDFKMKFDHSGDSAVLR
jgi:LEA14-like dessication related protein